MSALSGAWLLNSCGRHPDFYFSDKCPACEAQKPKLIVGGVCYRGETLPLTAWAQRLGFKRRTLEYRLAAGWTVRRAFETPAGEDPDGQG